MSNRRAFLFSAILLATSAASSALAEPAKTSPQRMTVVFINESKISVKPGNGKDKSIESTKYRINDATIVTVNGETSSREAIKPGHKVIITPVEGQPDLAATIDVQKSAGK